MKVINRYTNNLKKVFIDAKDKHEANVQSNEVLAEMSHDKIFLTEVFTQHIRKKDSLNTKHFFTVGIDIELNEHFGLVANCWIPLENNADNISTTAIHHHGEMLLSTVTSFGCGYEHYLFTEPKIIDEKAEKFSIGLTERTFHPLHHTMFVDAYIPHLPLFPPDTSVTYALWSDRKKTTWKDKIKRHPIVQNNKNLIRDFAVKAGLAKQLEIKIGTYFDYFPTEEGFCGILERKQPERGPNEDYLQSLFHLIQRTENDSLVTEFEAKLDSTEKIDNRQKVKDLVADLRKGIEIKGVISPSLLGNKGLNFTREEILQALKAQNN
ncbi:MAG: hypothetical protein MUC29_02700 [Pyrinomonadaceae bacterium]|jgi:hypothetical protein|nr:hypothetical protein [Pyrinomonadaceae bacterium]